LTTYREAEAADNVVILNSVLPLPYLSVKFVTYTYSFVPD
jgi:hypothetical protein